MYALIDDEVARLMGELKGPAKSADAATKKYLNRFDEDAKLVEAVGKARRAYEDAVAALALSRAQTKRLDAARWEALDACTEFEQSIQALKGFKQALVALRAADIDPSEIIEADLYVHAIGEDDASDFDRRRARCATLTDREKSIIYDGGWLQEHAKRLKALGYDPTEFLGG